jgi:hypothetical protein
MMKEDEEVVADTTSTPEGILKGGHTIVEVHLLPKIIGYMKWMN